jgi:hypothetical protein
MSIIPNRAFTVKAEKTLNVIQSPISVHLPVPETVNDFPSDIQLFKGQAILDTGATGSVITSRVIAELGLMPVSKTIRIGVDGPETVNVYMVGMRLPNGVGIRSMTVTETKGLVGNFDVLIGMDIINLGDFAISNLGHKTTFSFRVPSCECFDFVVNKPEQTPVRAIKQQKRNERCQCGSGKKFKDCCGRHTNL